MFDGTKVNNKLSKSDTLNDILTFNISGVGIMVLSFLFFYSCIKRGIGGLNPKNSAFGVCQTCQRICFRYAKIIYYYVCHFIN